MVVRKSAGLDRDEDGQEVVVDEPAHGEFFGFASDAGSRRLIKPTLRPWRTQCLEVSEAIRDAAATQAARGHGYVDGAGEAVSRIRNNWYGCAPMRNANDMIEEKSTLPDRIADSMVQFGGSWTFIVGFLVLSRHLHGNQRCMRRAAWDPYPFILLNLILSLLAAIQAP